MTINVDNNVSVGPLKPGRTFYSELFIGITILHFGLNLAYDNLRLFIMYSDQPTRAIIHRSLNDASLWTRVSATESAQGRLSPLRQLNKPSLTLPFLPLTFVDGGPGV
jgi:hypothetical protein